MEVGSGERLLAYHRVVLALLLIAVLLLVLYFVVRKAVMHGILDADEAREARDRGARFDRQLRDGTLPDAPTS
jgi:hypothetical protein